MIRHFIKALIVTVIAAPIGAAAQSFTGWHALELDRTTVSEALQKFPEPKSDRSNEKFRPLKYDEWFVKDAAFRVLHYENIEGFSDVKLYFRGDRLVVIHIEPRKLKAATVQQTYAADFEVLVSGADKAVSPRSIETEKGRSYPKKFPTVYYLLYRAERSTFFVMVGNTGLRSILGGEDDMNSFPGEAKQIQIISNTLKQGADLLK